MRLNNENAAIFVPLFYPLGVERLSYICKRFFCFTQNNMGHNNDSAVKPTSWSRSKQEMRNKF